MKIIFKQILIAVSVAFFLFTAAACTKTPLGSENATTSLVPSASLTEKGDVVVASGSLGGTWYPFGESVGMAIKNAGYTYTNIPGGGNSNIIAVSTGEADIGLTMTTSMGMAAEGSPEFKGIKYENVSAVLRLFDDPLHILVAADSKIESIADLKGKKIGIATAGQLSETVALDALKVYGIDEKDVDLQRGTPSDHTTLYKDGHIDAWLYIMMPPSSQAMDMAISKPSKMLSIEDGDVEKFEEIRKGYSMSVIPAGTYKGIDYDVKCINTDVVLIVSDDKSEEEVYDMVKALVEGREAFGDALSSMKGVTPEQLAAIADGVKIHPGALKYFKEQGLK